MTLLSKRIIYQSELDGGAAIIVPSPNCPFTIEELALKEVPAGKPYVIVDVEDIPSDRSFRNAWEADVSNPHGYGLGHEAFVALKKAEEAAAEETTVEVIQ